MIYMGHIDRDKLNQINDIRQNVNEPLISSPQVKIHKNDVQHIWNRRINDGGSTPKDVANTLKQGVFSKDSQVFPGNVSRNQLMIKTGNKHPYMSIISKDEAFDGVAIRNTMKKDLSTLRNRFPNLKFPNSKEKKNVEWLWMDGVPHHCNMNTSCSAVAPTFCASKPLFF